MRSVESSIASAMPSAAQARRYLQEHGFDHDWCDRFRHLVQLVQRNAQFRQFGCNLPGLADLALAQPVLDDIFARRDIHSRELFTGVHFSEDSLVPCLRVRSLRFCHAQVTHTQRVVDEELQLPAACRRQSAARPTQDCSTRVPRLPASLPSATSFSDCCSIRVTSRTPLQQRADYSLRHGWDGRQHLREEVAMILKRPRGRYRVHSAAVIGHA